MTDGEKLIKSVLEMINRNLENQKDFAITFTFFNEELKVSCLVNENQEIEN